MAFAGDTLRAEGSVSEVNGNVVVLQQRLLNGDRVIAECTSSLSLR
jgi:acyl-coenzyme A thioesterase PaaI-like protein